MTPPTTNQGVFNIIVLMKYYLTMWFRSSHTLQSLTNIAYSNENFIFTVIEQNGFDGIKKIFTKTTNWYSCTLINALA